MSEPPAHGTSSLRFPRRGRIWLPYRMHSVPALVRRLAVRHPEFAGLIGSAEFATICARERIAIRVVHMPPEVNARLLRVGQHAHIHLAEVLSRAERVFYGLHELSHYFRDDPGVPAYYADGDGAGPDEEFANVFAHYCTVQLRNVLDNSWLTG